MKTRDFFYSDQQYNRYLFAVEFGNKLIQLQKQGYIIFNEDGEIINGKFVIAEKDDEWSAVYIHRDSCKISMVDFEYWDDGRPWICSKQEIKRCFSQFKCVHPKHIVSIK